MTFVEIESIEELKEVEDVFDITVENNHNFFANGLLVHNCLGGIYAGDYWRNIESGDEAVLNSMRETTQKMQSIFGNRWLAELQWIKHPDQHKMHKFILQVAKEMNVPIISTCDSHYPTPDTWKDRVLYKKLNPKFMNKEMESSLPMDIDEVGYELYPKNGDQMWEAYKHYSQFADFSYDDDIILGSIEKTYEIAHEWIEDFTPDNTVKLPSFVIPEGKTADQSLREMAEFELAKMGLDSDSDDSKRYMKQLDKELNIISARGFSSYFLTMKQISDIAREHVLVGPGRGSGAGALVSYVLGITQVDPLRWGLMFSRFLREDAGKAEGLILDEEEGREREVIKITTEDGDFSVTPNVELRVKRNNKIINILAKDLKGGDDIISL